MLDREIVKEFLDENLQERGMGSLEGIKKSDLVETFCLYVENDYYEWLKDNFKSFFNHGNPDWDWIKNNIKHYKND
ncbi:MAG: hypothetical protein KJ887_02025 [Candidatus Omnitrophica bacterium]|nr:hypothetical protein [Candidatus Omnitrophota bacterium]MBU1047841.1 hypothetical protein [Candidatus Omnitrophota bacterium]MBU1630515.1 hypothetical protein [Candidatus Omnitrophota bacterium]MBU1766886.1 hypothetical protein [Candidatus Omnitrophota bacterium]MBU1888463.1 hypothetical protein [Candidatus Omnitrophota bacterium]